jgi:endogenous inhibitor of DNA gyrase (YacG/DUF329 family)
MAIQFQCPGCSQPIEVDAEHAGSVAACPYCQQVVNVPHESTYRPAEVPPARPAAFSPGGNPPGVYGAPLPPPGGLHVGPVVDPRSRTARRVGILALLAIAAALVLFMTVAIMAASAFGSRPDALTPEAQREILEQMQENPVWMVLIGALYVSLLAGLVLAIISVAISRRGNWPGIAALVSSGMLMLLLCAGLVFQLMAGAAGLAG